MAKDLFTTRMRRDTRYVHSLSDSLVNAKFAISLSDEKVWAGGLFVFYNVFAYLEDAQERLNMPELNSLFVDPILYRKSAFETDLDHYLGDSWRSEPRSEALQGYLLELERLERTNPKLLIAYVYHLYLGLLSGGQILASKRRLMANPYKEYYKDRVTDFTSANIPQLKFNIRSAMNKMAEKFSEHEKEELIRESQRVFLLNNSIVSEVGGQAEALMALFYKLAIIGIAITGIFIVYKFFK